MIAEGHLIIRVFSAWVVKNIALLKKKKPIMLKEVI